jgi:hypothetical protein
MFRSLLQGTCTLYFNKKRILYAPVKLFLRARVRHVVTQMIRLLLYNVTILYCDIVAERPK